MNRGNPSITIDYECRRQRFEAAIEIARLVVAQHNTIIDLSLRNKGVDSLPAVVIHRDAENFEPSVLVLAFELREPGNLLGTGAAPGGPKVEEHHLAAVIAQVDHFAIGIFQSKIRSMFALTGLLNRRGNGSRRRAGNHSKDHANTGDSSKTEIRSRTGHDSIIAGPYNNCMDLAALLTEQANPESAGIDKLSTVEMLRVINNEDRKVADSVRAEIPQIAKAIDGIVEAFRNGGRLFYIGAGTSGRLGVLDAAECPPTFNVSPELVQGIIAGGEPALVRATETTEDDPAIGVRDLKLRGFRQADVLCGIAASGRTPYVLGAVDEANRLGGLTLGISCTPDSELARRAKIAITPLCGPEIIAGSTRLKAGTATKLVLNMLTTGSFIRLGYVRGNLMVNVQPKNSKLLDRSRRIIAAATGASYDDAGCMLTAAGNDVRRAIEIWEEARRNG